MKSLSCLAAIIFLSGCIVDLEIDPEAEEGLSSSSGGGTAAQSSQSEGGDGGGGEGGAGNVGGSGGAETPEPLPQSYVPCEVGQCWDAPSVTAMCGQVGIGEDFSSGKYNVHQRVVTVPGEVAVDLTLAKTAGSWDPALLVADENGAIVHDGELSSSDNELEVKLLSTGQDSSAAAVRITSQSPAKLNVFVTSWSVVDSGFAQPMPAAATYDLTLAAACEPPPPGELLSPPNFDPNNKQGGFFLLPYSDPSGLYTRKADDCARGSKQLIDVIYTVATHFKTLRPELAPISVMDLNEGSCSTVNHATHDDGTHADIVAGCATKVSCQDNAPAIELAKLFVDTGVVCGILNNDTAVQAEVNAYFQSKFSYEPWKGKFMRSVSGHTHHFHVRVKKPNGQCN